jgi:hypothetical protein
MFEQYAAERLYARKIIPVKARQQRAVDIQNPQTAAIPGIKWHHHLGC